MHTRYGLQRRGTRKYIEKKKKPHTWVKICMLRRLKHRSALEMNSHQDEAEKWLIYWLSDNHSTYLFIYRYGGGWSSRNLNLYSARSVCVIRPYTWLGTSSRLRMYIYIYIHLFRWGKMTSIYIYMRKDNHHDEFCIIVKSRGILPRADKRQYEQHRASTWIKLKSHIFHSRPSRRCRPHHQRNKLKFAANVVLFFVAF